MAQTRRATTLDVDFGFAKVEGLMLPDGSYAIAVSQIAEKFSFSQSHATRQVKALLGKSSDLTKVSSDIAQRPVNVVTIAQFKSVVLALSKQGDPVAGAFVEALIEEGIERRFDTAAGVKVEEAEYNKRVADRMQRVKTLRQWTDVIRDRHRALHGCDAPTETYKELMRRVNLALFNVAHFKCDRDNMTEDQQMTIRTFEGLLCHIADNNPRADVGSLVTRAIKIWSA